VLDPTPRSFRSTTSRSDARAGTLAGAAPAPDSSKNSTRPLNSAAHVRASTTPLTASPCTRWKRSTAPRVIGPKIPSAVTPT
jgi:hypothetical protein